MTLGDHININHTVQSQSIPACIGAMKGGGNCCAVPVSIPHPSLKGQVRSRKPYEEETIQKTKLSEYSLFK